MKTPIQTDCPKCLGKGFVANLDASKGPVGIKLCPKCKGKGRVDTGAWVDDNQKGEVK